MCGAGCRHHQEEVGGHRHALSAQRVQEPRPRPEQAQPRLRHFYRSFKIRRRRSCWDLWRIRSCCFVVVIRRADDLLVITVGCCVTVENFRWCEEFCDSWLAEKRKIRGFYRNVMQKEMIPKDIVPFLENFPIPPIIYRH
jgi:hypothetical protein